MMKPQGFLKGHPVSLTVLDYGLFRVHANGRVIGICGFLIRTSKNEQVLVDTGFPEKYAQDCQAASAEDRLYEFGEVLQCTAHNLAKAQLELAGSSLDHVNLMIQTHTHIDHVGAMDACPQAPILISRAERDLPRPLYWGDKRPINWPDRKYLLVDEDLRIGPGFEVFHVPGHAPGQLALMIELPVTGPVLLTSDAISRPAEIDEKFAGSWNENLALRHGERLMRLAGEKDAFVIFGHCPDQWKSLRKAPDCYE